MAFDRGKRKKITVIALTTILVVAAVVGTFVHARKFVQSKKSKAIEIDTQKAGGKKTAILIAATTVIILCKYTDFRDICRQTLDRIRAGLREPRDLIKGGFLAAVDNIQFAIERSHSLRQAAKDPRAAMALDQCKELLNTSIEDLKRSINRVNLFDITKLKDNTVELRVWLSGAVTYQETCLDAFENTTGDSGLMMTRLLELGNKLTRNSLAMIDGVIELSGGAASKNNDPWIIPQPKQPNTVVDWKIHGEDPKPNNVVVDWKVDQPRQRQKSISVDWKAGWSVSRSRTRTVQGGSMPQPMDSNPNAGGAMPNAGNRRMLDQSSNEEYLDPDLHSNMQMIGDPSDEENIVTHTIPELSHDPNTPYPSWADSSRRSLINVNPGNLKPNAVVAQDGSGSFKTIMEAVHTAPQKSGEPFIILIKTGTYKEDVTIPRHVDNVVFIGEGPTKTRITGSKNYIDGISTYNTATVAVNGDGFMARDLGFENSAGPEKHQAVALRVSADMSIFHNCMMDGFQDTLYTHSYRQFYRHCTISGTIDFIFGNAAAVFQDCKMIVRKPMSNQGCMVTAQGRKDQHSVGGLVLDGCTITAEPEFMNAVPMPKSYLGRPWKEFSRTIIMQSFIDKNIDPEGWSPWTGTFGQDTCYYAEFNNKGPGADTSRRVTWKGIKKISPQEAQRFTPGTYIQGDTWIKASNVPYDAGMMKI